jgi:putative endopeptidase
MPHNNFFEFVNKSYLGQDIPSDETSVSNFTDISNRNIKNTISLLKQLQPTNKSEKLLKAIYNKKTDFKNLSRSEQYNNCGQMLYIIDDVFAKKSLIGKISMLNKYGINAFISYGVSDNPSEKILKPYIIDIGQTSLSFSKNYYFDKKYQRELNGLLKYRLDILNILSDTYPSCFKFIGDIKQFSADIHQIEMLLAPYVFSNECKRDIKNRINIYKLNDIDNIFPNLKLLDDIFLAEYKLINKNEVEVIFCNDILKSKKNIETNTKMTKEHDDGDYYWYVLDNLFLLYENDEVMKSKIDNYIMWKIINNYVGFISEEMRIKKFEFYGRFLNGQTKEKSDEELATIYLMHSLPELIGKLFCNKYFTSDSKNLMKDLIDCLLDTYEHNFLNKCKWLTDSNSLMEAIQKLKILKIDSHQKVGYQEEIHYKHNYNILFSLLADKHIESLTLLEFNNILIKWQNILEVENLNRIEQDIYKWEMCPIEVNAYYHPIKNEIVFPAGILQKPFFIYLTENNINNKGIDISNDEELNKLLSDRLRLTRLDNKYLNLQYVTMASNFGSIGAVIGHEISHGFDDQGSKFDANGKLREWWTDEVRKKYTNITNKIIEQFNKYNLDLKIDDKLETFKINGNLTIGENIADLFGLSIAIDSFKEYHKKKSSNKSLDEGMMELLVSYGNTWRYLEKPEKTKNRIVNDVHAPPLYRVNGTLSNITEFNNIFLDNKNCDDLIKIFG